MCTAHHSSHLLFNYRHKMPKTNSIDISRNPGRPGLIHSNTSKTVLRQEWVDDPNMTREIRIVQFEICDAILRNNHVQAMRALSIVQWENSGEICKFDDNPSRKRLLNPNLIDIHAIDAWEIFRRTIRHSTLLHEAAAYCSAMAGNVDDTQITRMLISSGANVNLIDSSGYTALHTAAYSNNVEACKVLLDAGASINLLSHRGQSPLHTAAYNNCSDVCAFLIQAGANYKTQNVRGETAQDLASNLQKNKANQVLNAAEINQLMLRLAKKKVEDAENNPQDEDRPPIFYKQNLR